MVSRCDSEVYAKLIILGESQVGKSSFFERITHGDFNPIYQPTIGVDFKMRSFDIEGSYVELQIWDLKGQPRFQSIRLLNTKGPRGVIMIYSVDSLESFSSIPRCFEEVKEFCKSNIPIVLVANKADLSDRQVTTEQGVMLAAELQVPFFEVSVKEGSNIEAPVYYLARTFLNLSNIF